jgi:tetratricopeptide (TPR) repeat protein
MVVFHFMQSDAYKRYVQFVLDMYRLMDQGKFESEEACVLRESVEGVWDDLTKEERKRLRGLSLDLNGMREKERKLEGAIDRGRGKLIAAAQLRDRGQYDEALELLRQSENEIYLPFLSFLRGRIWMELDCLDVATEFFRDAWALDKNNQQLQSMYLQVLRQNNLPEAKKEADKVIASPEKYQVILLAFAIEVESASIDEGSPSAKDQYLKLLPVLKRSINRMLFGEPPLIPPVLSMCVVMLADIYEKLHQTSDAEEALTFAMAIDGNSPDLYAARGKLRYPKEEGIKDLLAAIQLGTPAVWPYLWVARYYFDKKEYEQCLAICEAGAVRRTTSRVRSELWQLAAMARASISPSWEDVSRLFELALKEDASHPRAKKNYMIFQSAVEHNRHHFEWFVSPEEEYRAVQKIETANRFNRIMPLKPTKPVAETVC